MSVHMKARPTNKTVENGEVRLTFGGYTYSAEIPAVSRERVNSLIDQIVHHVQMAAQADAEAALRAEHGPGGIPADEVFKDAFGGRTNMVAALVRGCRRDNKMTQV
ncbi:MAG: hypothetical protein EOO77_22630, partial [Oxalobacteraceae bacterium]